jgi:SnoaL-like domain
VGLVFRLVTHEVGLGGRGEVRARSQEEASALFARYGAAVDERDRAGLGVVFAAAGTFLNAEVGGETIGPLSPREAIVDFVAGATADPARQLRHVVTNVLREGDRVRANLVLFATAAGTTSLAATGVYDGEVVEEDGALRFARLDCLLDAPL